MIDLTPLDVRKKKGDFARALRGYEPGAVDHFLELVADRMEELVRENLALRERSAQSTEMLAGYRDRERALNEALVTAQQMREEMRQAAAREAELVLGEARQQAATAGEALRRVQADRAKFLRSFRAFVERQLGDIEQEEAFLRESTAPDEG